MIYSGSVKKFCYEDPSLIENYEQAINDSTQMWVCHHRLETDENKSMQQLKDEGRYYNVPASELILLTKSEHIILHNKNMREETKILKSKSFTGIKNPMYGKNAENFMTPEKIKEKRKKISEKLTGRKQSKEEIQKHSESMKGKNKGKHRVYDNIEHTKWHMEK